MKVIRLVAIPATLLVAGALLAAASPAQAGHATHAAAASQHAAINCEYSSLCAEVANPADVFGSEYVGHDEPSAVFYSNTAGGRESHDLFAAAAARPLTGQSEYAR
jgi:hypothetical protein